MSLMALKENHNQFCDNNQSRCAGSIVVERSQNMSRNDPSWKSLCIENVVENGYRDFGFLAVLVEIVTPAAQDILDNHVLCHY
eukprot:g45914.t1